MGVMGWLASNNKTRRVKMGAWMWLRRRRDAPKSGAESEESEEVVSIGGNAWPLEGGSGAKEAAVSS